MTNESTSSGFTIVELMVTLAVAAVLMGFALPAFNDFVRQRTMTARVNDFVLAVTYARSEAVRRGAPVSLVAADPDEDDDNEWGGGYCVIVGAPDDCTDEASVLRSFEPFDDATLNADGGLDGESTLTFNARGMLSEPLAGTIELCSDEADPGRSISLTATGRPDAEEFDCDA